MFEAAFVQQLDARAYQLVVGVWGLYWPLLLLTVLLTAIERLVPLERNQPWRPWFFNLAWYALVLAIGIVLSWTAWGEFVTWLASIYTGQLRLPAPQGALGELGRFMLVLLVYDFFSYWAHRMQHAVPALWVLHQFHHDERHMNAAAGARAHWLNIVYLQLVVTVPLTWLLGLDSYSVTVYLLIHAVQAFSHMNIRLELGRASSWLVGPQFHRMHHARERTRYDRNFSNLLPLWDRLFGTFEAPVAGDFAPTGINDIPSTDSWGKAFVQPVADWWHMLRHWMGRA